MQIKAGTKLDYDLEYQTHEKRISKVKTRSPEGKSKIR